MSATVSLSPLFTHMLEMARTVAGWKHNRCPDVGFSISNCTYSGEETACRPRFYEIGKSIEDARRGGGDFFRTPLKQHYIGNLPPLCLNMCIKN